MDEDNNGLRFTPVPDNLPSGLIKGTDLNRGVISSIDYTLPSEPIIVDILIKDIDETKKAAAVYRVEIEFAEPRTVNKVTFLLEDHLGPIPGVGEEVSVFYIKNLCLVCFE